MDDANVVCRMLNFGPAVEATEFAQFGQGQGDIVMSHVNCSGKELNIVNCTYIEPGKHKCQHKEDAGVVCAPQGMMLISYSSISMLPK